MAAMVMSLTCLDRPEALDLCGMSCARTRSIGFGGVGVSIVGPGHR